MLAARCALAAAVMAACGGRTANVPMEAIEWPPLAMDAETGFNSADRDAAIAAADPPPPLAAPEPGSGVALRWGMTVTGQLMTVDYTVFNETSAAIAVADAMTAGRPLPDDATILGDVDPDVIVFSRADLKHEPNVYLYRPPSPPHYRELAAGASLAGTIKVALPIVAWRHYGVAYAITGHRTKAVLEIGFATYRPDLVAAGTMRGSETIIRGNVQPLPPGARLASPEEQVKLSHAVELPSGYSSGSASR